MKPRYHDIPEELRALPNWVVWNLEKQAGRSGVVRETKVPYNARSGTHAKSNNPATWSAFGAAAEALKRGYAGLGFCLTQPYVGVDLDGCRDGEKYAPWADQIICELNSYSELSPSQRGIHVLVKGELPDGSRQKDMGGDHHGVGLYDAARGRYLTMTGCRVYGNGGIAERTAELVRIHARLFPPNARNTRLPAPASPSPESDDDLIKRARNANNGGKFMRLWEGQWKGSYASQSEADLALCINLAFWTRRDAARVDALFRRSGLMREKWNRADYREATIKSALAQQIETYKPLTIETPLEWHGLLIKTSHGDIKPLLANAIAALSNAPEWSGVLSFNEFAVRVQTQRKTPWGGDAGEWTDNDDRRTTEWLQRQGVWVTTNVAGEAVQTVAMVDRRHPVRSYLSSLSWDRTKRLDRWAATYLGACGESEDIACKFGRLWMISAVARIMKPGSKADCGLVLEGDQGTGKSSALRILGEPWFTDHLADLGSKDAAMQCHGVWIIEIAELDSFNRSEASRIKAFMSSTFDRIRLPYGKNVVEWPRSCVFAGSVNHDAYLRDETGARRFWPIRCGRIDLELLSRDRDQLWAEAVAQFNAGAAWWLQDRASIARAETEQSSRYQEGAWDSLIAKWLVEPTERLDEHGHPVAPFSSDAHSVTLSDILRHCIGKGQQHWTRADQITAAAVLKRLGWERFRQRDGANLEWRYRRKTK